MCKLEGCSINTTSKQKLYCGHQDDYGTCSYHRDRAIRRQRYAQKNKAGGAGKKIYRKICAHCNHLLITTVHNQLYHGDEQTKETCAYINRLARKREYFKIFMQKKQKEG
jgi:hypothetical protein